MKKSKWATKSLDVWKSGGRVPTTKSHRTLPKGREFFNTLRLLYNFPIFFTITNFSYNPKRLLKLDTHYSLLLQILKGWHDGHDESEDRDAPTPCPRVRGYRTSVRLPNTPRYLSLITGKVSHFIETLGLRRSTVRYQVPYLATISRVGSTFLSICLMSISNFWKRKLS